jgi:hypothetical protein
VKRLIAGCFLLLVYAGACKAQNNNPFFELNSDSTLHYGVGVFGNYNAGSNAITNGFLNSFYTGQYIDQTQKDRVQARLNRYNRLGGDANAGLFYLNHMDSCFGKKVFAWFVSVKSRAHVDMQFTRDLFNVAFYGNSSYRGQTADFSGSQLNEVQYQQFQAGLVSDRFGVGISVYNGQQFQLLNAKTAEMYTSTFGEYIDMNTSYKMITSNPNSTGYGSLNGMGAGLDFYGRMPFVLLKKHPCDLLVELSDFGFIRWNQKTEHYQNDTLYHFDGFAVKNVFQLADTSVHLSAKSVINAKPNAREAYASYLPATLDVKCVPLGDVYQCIVGIRYRFSSNYTPYAYGQFRYHFGPRYSVTAELGYGGYANLQAGLFLNAKLGRGTSIHLGTNNVAGYIAPQTTTGQGVFFSLSQLFH